MHEQPLLAWARARRMLDAFVRPAVHGPAIPLDVVALQVPGEPITVGEARAAAFAAFAVGDGWGTLWGTTWLRMRGTVPAEWAGEEVVARIGLGYTGQTGFGAEALLWDAAHDAPLQGLSPNHDSVPISGDVVDLLIEAAANPVLDQERPVSLSLLPGSDDPPAPLFRLQRAEICVLHRDV